MYSICTIVFTWIFWMQFLTQYVDDALLFFLKAYIASGLRLRVIWYVSIIITEELSNRRMPQNGGYLQYVMNINVHHELFLCVILEWSTDKLSCRASSWPTCCPTTTQWPTQIPRWFNLPVCSTYLFKLSDSVACGWMQNCCWCFVFEFVVSCV